MRKRQQHAALAAAFYDLEASSALPLSGAVRVERGNVALTASRPPSSGRHHSLDILQRLFGVPGIVSFAPDEGRHRRGGWVLDRAIASLGRREWWATFTGRFRIQEVLSQTIERNGKSWRKLVQNPEYYACIARVRGQVGKNLLVSSSAEIDAFDLQSFRSVRTTSELRWRRGKRIFAAEVSRNLRTLSRHMASHGEVFKYGAEYSTVPELLTLSVFPAPQIQRNSFSYRAGVVLRRDDARADPASPTRTEASETNNQGSNLFDRSDSEERQGLHEESTGRYQYKAGILALGWDKTWYKPKRVASMLQGERKRWSILAPAAGFTGGLTAALVSKLKWSHNSSHFFYTSAESQLDARVSYTLGNFSKWALDFTRLALTTTAGAAAGSPLPIKPSGEQLITLEEIRADAVATIEQQVFGPVRGKAELGLSRARNKTGMDTRLWSVLSLEVALFNGAARAVTWWCPEQREAMMEIRLLDQ